MKTQNVKLKPPEKGAGVRKRKHPEFCNSDINISKNDQIKKNKKNYFDTELQWYMLKNLPILPTVHIPFTYVPAQRAFVTWSTNTADCSLGKWETRIS